MTVKSSEPKEIEGKELDSRGKNVDLNVLRSAPGAGSGRRALLNTVEASPQEGVGVKQGHGEQHLSGVD